MLLWRNNENYPLIILEYPPYLFHWSLPLITLPQWPTRGNQSIVRSKFLPYHSPVFLACKKVKTVLGSKEDIVVYNFYCCHPVGIAVS